MADTVTYEIIRHFGVISTDRNGWKRELNLVHWNNSSKGPVFDYRSWSDDHKKMSRGVTMNHEEASKLAELLQAAL